jgi:uncharacterized membrane protein YozB (DUF420 family)
MTDGLQYLGWASTFLVLLGFWANSKNERLIAFTAWIIGDIGWIVYDIYINNWSHMTLSAVIIALNLFGIYNTNKHDSKRISKISK